MPAFVCGVCSRAFGSEFNYQRHLLTRAHRRAEEIASAFGEGDGGKFVCHICNASFTRRDNHRRHVMSHEGGEERLCFRCGLCSSCFKNKDELTSHRRREHVRHHDFKLVESAHRRQCQLLRAYFPESAATVDEALVYAYSQLEKMLTSALVEVPFFKCFLTVFVEMGKYDEEGRLAALEVFPFRGFTMTLGRETELKSELRKTLGDVERNVDEFLFQGSGWVVERPVYMDVEISECRVLKGGAAGGGPTCGRHAAGYRRGRGAVPLNVSGEEEEEEDAGMCFYLAVASHFLPSTATTADLRRFVEREFVLPPEQSRKEVTLEMARRFEADNARHEISINIVYRDETNAVVPVVASANPLAKNLVVLMLFHVRSGGEEGDRGVMHYALVDNPGRIFADRTENSWGRLQTRNVFICFNCFNAIRSEGAYREHIAFCHQRNCQRVCLPKRGEVLAFDESSIAGDRRTFLSAFLLFYDFEALQVDPAKRCSCPEEKVKAREWWEGLTEGERVGHLLEQQMLEGEAADVWRADVLVDGSTRARPRPVPRAQRLPRMCEHKVRVLKNQPPFAYSLLLVDREGTVREAKTYVGLDAAENFVATVLNLADAYLPTLSPGLPMEELTREQRRTAYAASKCYLCGVAFTSFCRRCLDHDHLTGRLLGTAHDYCNLRRRERAQLSCFAHNFSGYDSHFLVRAMAREPRVTNTFAIPLNTQKFKSVTVNKRIRFLDSCQFLPSSLAKLTETLVASDSPFSILDKMAPRPEEKRLLQRKGVYPYSFATSPEALAAATALPERSHFFSELSGEECSEADYEHARQVWKTFGCKNMLDYTALYVRADVHLLADVVMDHRNLVWDHFGLDICQYLSLPHVAKDAMLKQTGAKIELIDDQEMSYLLQNNIRGGLSYVNLRHAKRIQEFQLPLQQGYDYSFRTQPQTLLYLDANNLYGYAMSAPLPQRDFRWMTAEELREFDPSRDVRLEDGPGYILEVDLDYPPELHLPHNSFPLAPVTMDIDYSHLSPYSRSCLEAMGQDPRRYKARKLTSTFEPRRKYLVHGLNLALYLRHGLKLRRIHRGITFHQARYLEPFITGCTRKRAAAKTKTEADMYKLFCNATYGKLIESVEKRMDAFFNRDREAALRRSSSPLYKGSLICDDDLTISFQGKRVVQMRQCWAVGFSILELSKWHMASLYYDRIVPALGRGNVAVVMSDTDSFLLATSSADEESTMRLLAPYMDFSNLDPEHPLYSSAHARVPGLLKNEVPRAVIEEVVALKSKTYTVHSRPVMSAQKAAAYTVAGDDGGRVENKAKGVTEASRRRLTLRDYRRCLRNMTRVEVEEHNIRSVRHTNQLVRGKKVAFSSFDDKRYLICPIHSVPYGSVVIRAREKMSREGGEDFCFLCDEPDLLC